MCDKVLVLHEGEMLSFDTKEEALRLNPSLEDYFLAKVRDKKGLCGFVREDAMEQFFCQFEQRALQAPQAEKNTWFSSSWARPSAWPALCGCSL